MLQACQITHFACEIPLKMEASVPEAQASEQQEGRQGPLNVMSRKHHRTRCFHVKADAVLLGQSRAHLSHCSQVVLEQTLQKAAPCRQTASYPCRDRPCISALSARRQHKGEAAAPAASPSRGSTSWTGVFLQPCQFGGRRDVPVKWEQHCPAGPLRRENTARGLCEACLLNKTRSPLLRLCRG